MSSFSFLNHGVTTFASAANATLQDNFNVSSTTDNQGGDTTFNFSNNMDNDDFAIFGNSLGPSHDQAAISSVNTRSTSSMRCLVFDDVKNSNGRFDTGYHTVGNVGDNAS